MFYVQPYFVSFFHRLPKFKVDVLCASSEFFETVRMVFCFYFCPHSLGPSLLTDVKLFVSYFRARSYCRLYLLQWNIQTAVCI
jgi:hypothetical protein